MKVFFFTLGCKVNQYETVILKNIFLKQNFELAKEKEDANIYIINSCTVTSTSDRKINKLINQIKNINKNGVIALTGCIPQAFTNREDIFKKVSIVTGNQDKFKLPEILKKFLEEKNKIIDIKEHEKKEDFNNFKIEKTFKTPRAFLKIQDGCNRFCTYCIIPKARGFIKSKSLETIVEESKTIAENGCLEIVLVGINLSFFGKDIKNINLIDAVKACSSVEKIKRVRLSSLEPNLLTNEQFLTLSKEEKFCPQFHFSLQSGSNTTLKRMGRHYDKDEYIKSVNYIFKIFKNPSITTDIIVGFPGETEEEFKESLDFIERIGFSRVHIFPYSKRPGTKAATMENQLSREEKKARVKRMEEVAKKSTEKFLQNQIGKTLEILFETKKNDIYNGYSKNYCMVKTFSKEDICGKIEKVKIKSLKDGILEGEILK